MTHNDCNFIFISANDGRMYRLKKHWIRRISCHKYDLWISMCFVWFKRTQRGIDALPSRSLSHFQRISVANHTNSNRFVIIDLSAIGTIISQIQTSFNFCWYRFGELLTVARCDGQFMLSSKYLSGVATFLRAKCQLNLLANSYSFPRILPGLK